MKFLLAAFTFFTSSSLLLAEAGSLDHWSWTTAKDGIVMGQEFTWKISDEACAKLPLGCSAAEKSSFPSAAAKDAALAYLKEQLAERTVIGGYEGMDISQFQMSAFGFKQVYVRATESDPFTPSDKWVRYIEYSNGWMFMLMKIYLLPDDTVLRPEIKRLQEPPAA